MRLQPVRPDPDADLRVSLRAPLHPPRLVQLAYLDLLQAQGEVHQGEERGKLYI